MVISPQYPITEPVYGTKITSLRSNLALSYLDDTVLQEVDLQTDVIAPPWLEPPDLLMKGVFPKSYSTYANDPVSGNPWIRTESIFSSTGADVDELTSLVWQKGIAPPASIQSVKITNPLPYSSKVRLYGVDSSWAPDYSKWAPITFSLGASKFREYNTKSYCRKIVDAEAAALMIDCTMYDSTIGDNGVELIEAGTGFYFPFPDVDDKFMIPQGPTISVNMANIIDQYGPIISGIAALGVGAASLIPGLMDSGPVTKFASAFGMSVAETAAIFTLGLQNQWINTRNIAENLMMAGVGMGTAGAAGLFSSVGSLLPGKYGDVIGAGLSGLASFGGVLALLQMIDNCTVYTEW
jgi:hypothetical protein